MLYTHYLVSKSVLYTRWCVLPREPTRSNPLRSQVLGLRAQPRGRGHQGHGQDFFIHHKPAKISQNLDFFIPKQKTKIQENRKTSIFSSPQNDENPGKSRNLRFFCPPASKRLRRSKQLKIKENREKPDFFVPTLPKRAGVHERARPLEPPEGGEAAERASWTPLGGRNPPAGGRQASRRARQQREFR